METLICALHLSIPAPPKRYNYLNITMAMPGVRPSAAHWQGDRIMYASRVGARLVSHPHFAKVAVTGGPWIVR